MVINLGVFLTIGRITTSQDIVVRRLCIRAQLFRRLGALTTCECFLWKLWFLKLKIVTVINI